MAMAIVLEGAIKTRPAPEARCGRANEAKLLGHLTVVARWGSVPCTDLPVLTHTSGISTPMAAVLNCHQHADKTEQRAKWIVRG
jgi:hypothetical protein